MKMIIGKTLFILMLLLLKSSGQISDGEENDDIPDPEESEDEKKTFNGCKTAELPDTNNKWMENLDNNKPISTITIPGTHDTMAFYGGPAAKCQAWSLENQLKAGIRYLDLRVSGYGLRIMHGLIYQHTKLSEVLSTIRAFLSKFRTETVLVRVKPVFPIKGKVQDLVKNLISKANDIWDKESIPKIGEVRGKIVFVQKNSFKLGIILSETDRTGDYKVTTIQDKVEKIKQHLEEAAEKCRKGNALSLSYSSGTSFGTYMGFCLLPKAVAREINPWLYGHLAKKSESNPKPCFGIIAMDFPGFDLIDMVIKFNRPT